MGNVCAHYEHILIACQIFGCFKGRFNAINKRVHTTVRYILVDTVRTDDRSYTDSAAWPICSAIEYWLVAPGSSQNIRTHGRVRFHDFAVARVVTVKSPIV